MDRRSVGDGSATAVRAHASTACPTIGYRRRSFASHDSVCGKDVEPRTLEIFGALGVADRMMAAAGLYPPQRKYAPTAATTSSRRPKAWRPRPSNRTTCR